MLKHDSIRRYAIRGRTAAAVRWEKELKFTAASADLHPTGLSRAAIVCIRSMRVLPRSLRDGVWQGLGAQLPMEIAEAERPALGRVPSGAKAIVFSDHAELLSCLARDWDAGNLRTHWWWRSLLPGDDLDRLAKQAWLGSPQSVPAAIDHLLSIQPALPFLRFFEKDELATLFVQVVEAFGLVALGTGGASPPAEMEERRDIRGGTTPVPLLELPYLPPAVPSFVNDTRRPLVERRLVAAASVLIHSPARARSEKFAVEFHQWEQTSRSLEHGEAAPTGKVTAGGERSSERQNDRSLTSSSEEATLLPSLHLRGQNLTPRMSPPPEYSYAHQGDGATSSPPADNSATAGKSPRQSRHQVDSPREPSFELAEECIDSPSGGLFYLINVALALGFYSDFTSPQNGRLALPLWDFLELLGERFLGPTFADDPLKRLLARLSHRQPSEDPGAEFTPPDSLDFERWLDRTELQVRDRLEIAIGIHGEAMTTLVFRQRAAVGVTATRVDITYRLVEHPIALRLAGLDRDPGWVPAGGRTIAFHYE